MAGYEAVNRHAVDWSDGLLWLGNLQFVQRITEPEQIRPVLRIRTLKIENIETWMKKKFSHK